MLSELGQFTRSSEKLKAYHKALMAYKEQDWHTNPRAKHSHRNAVRQAKRAVQRSAGAVEELVSVSIFRHLPHDFMINALLIHRI
jgi:hypothetical protein